MGSIDNNSALFQVMAWHLIGAKPLPETMLPKTTEAYGMIRLQWVNKVNCHNYINTP